MVYFEHSLFRTNFLVPWQLEIAYVYCVRTCTRMHACMPEYGKAAPQIYKWYVDDIFAAINDKNVATDFFTYTEEKYPNSLRKINQMIYYYFRS